ncbi:F0F1 ATP synthase subunit delta [Spiractinospora alimapuensis]|uniref:F0F1 ATP synthase subunit delta n=1 Tax=Spiractinospora alimapuensis TaxID=2820884 RepID=UPI001EEB4FF6|nr:F0F1 ATP synthase subunit delta [Spiractinospora alimapuensis]QVQ54234.1 F0F1 ATP synthase subunit delta [Spiractinospora alimapuensis]
MFGASRGSLVEVTRHLDTVLESADASTLSRELFQVLHLLDREHGLRRLLADSAADGDRKTGLVGELLESQVSPATILVVNEVAKAEWSSARDMTDAVERLAVFAAVGIAGGAGQVEELEDDLFRFDRVVAAQPELRSALTQLEVAETHRRALVADLLQGKGTPASSLLISEVVADPRGRTLEQGLEAYRLLVAERAQRYVAVIRTATPLTDEQQSRLRRLLSTRYGREMHLDIEIAPELIGGMSIRVGDEEMDGTIAGRVAEVRRRLAG